MAEATVRPKGVPELQTVSSPQADVSSILTY